jgi:hypothetical protein
MAALCLGTSPMAQIRRLGAFAGISALAMVHQSGSTAGVFILMSLAPLVAAMRAWPLVPAPAPAG